MIFSAYLSICNWNKTVRVIEALDENLIIDKSAGTNYVMHAAKPKTPHRFLRTA